MDQAEYRALRLRPAPLAGLLLWAAAHLDELATQLAAIASELRLQVGPEP